MFSMCKVHVHSTYTVGEPSYTKIEHVQVIDLNYVYMYDIHRVDLKLILHTP